MIPDGESKRFDIGNPDVAPLTREQAENRNAWERHNREELRKREILNNRKWSWGIDNGTF